MENYNKGISIAEAQTLVDNWIKGLGKGYFSELTNMAILTEEVGELASVFARVYGDQKSKTGDKENVADELSDVLWVVLCLANQTGVDLTTAFTKNMQKKTNRDQGRF